MAEIRRLKTFSQSELSGIEQAANLRARAIAKEVGPLVIPIYGRIAALLYVEAENIFESQEEQYGRFGVGRAICPLASGLLNLRSRILKDVETVQKWPEDCFTRLILELIQQASVPAKKKVS